MGALEIEEDYALQIKIQNIKVSLSILWTTLPTTDSKYNIPTGLRMKRSVIYILKARNFPSRVSIRESWND